MKDVFPCTVRRCLPYDSSFVLHNRMSVGCRVFSTYYACFNIMLHDAPVSILTFKPRPLMSRTACHSLFLELSTVYTNMLLPACLFEFGLTVCTGVFFCVCFALTKLLQHRAKWLRIPHLLQLLPYAGQLLVACVVSQNLHALLILSRVLGTLPIVITSVTATATVGALHCT